MSRVKSPGHNISEPQRLDSHRQPAQLLFSRLSLRQRLPLLIGTLLLGIIIASIWASYSGVKDSALKAGHERLRGEELPAGVEVRAVAPTADGMVDVLAMLRLLADDYGVRMALNEGGPLVLASFLAAGVVDELFLTLAPQLVGRTIATPRRSLVEGVAFSPADAPNAQIFSVKQAGNHLFLRYAIGR